MLSWWDWTMLAVLCVCLLALWPIYNWRVKRKYWFETDNTRFKDDVFWQAAFVWIMCVTIWIVGRAVRLHNDTIGPAWDRGAEVGQKEQLRAQRHDPHEPWRGHRLSIARKYQIFNEQDADTVWEFLRNGQAGNDGFGEHQRELLRAYSLYDLADANRIARNWGLDPVTLEPVKKEKN